MRTPETRSNSDAYVARPTGYRLSGTATIGFANGELLRFQILGRYSAKTQKSKLLLRGDGADKGTHLLLSISGADRHIEWMHGTVGGQRIRFPSRG